MSELNLKVKLGVTTDKATLDKTLSEMNRIFKSIDASIDITNIDQAKKLQQELSKEYGKNLKIVTELNAKKKQGVTLSQEEENNLKEASSFLSGKKKILQDLNKQFKAIGVSSEQMATGVKNVGDNAANASTKASLLAKAFQFNQVAQSLNAITNSIAQFTGKYVELDKQVQNIGTLGVKNFENFKQAAIDASTEIPNDAAVIAESIYQAYSAGLQGTQEEILNFVKTAGKVGVAGLSDTTSAVNGLTSVLNAYKLNVSEVETVSDTFFAGIKLGKTTFEELNGSIATVTPIAAGLGIGFDQTTAAISRMTALGTPTARAATQIRAALVLLQKGGPGLNKALASQGRSLEEFTSQLQKPVSEGGGLVNALQGIREVVDKAGISLPAATGRIEAANAILQLTGENLQGAVDTLNNVELEIQGGAATKAYDVAAQGIEVRTTILLNKVQALFSGLFETLGSGATIALNTLTQLAPAITSFAALGSLIPAGSIGNIKTFAVSLVSKLVPSIVATSAASGAATISFGAMWTALTGPIGLAIAGVTAVTGALVYFLSQTEEGQKIWQDIKDAVSDALNFLITKFNEVSDALQPIFDAAIPVFSELGQIFLSVGEVIGSVLLVKLQFLWEQIKFGYDIVAGIIGFFLDFINVGESTDGMVSQIVAGLGSFKNVLRVLKASIEGVTSVFNFIREQIAGFVSDIKNFDLEGIIDRFTSLGSGAKEAFTEGFSSTNFNDLFSDLEESSEQAFENATKKISEIQKQGLSGDELRDADIELSKIYSNEIKKVQDALAQVKKDTSISIAERVDRQKQLNSLIEKLEQDLTDNRAKIYKENTQNVKQEVEEQAEIEEQASNNAFKLAEKRYKQETKLIKNAKENLDIEAERQRLIEGREKSTIDELAANQRLLDSLNEQKNKLEEILGIKIDDKGNIVDFGLAVADEEKEKVTDEVTALTKEIAKAKNNEIKLKADISIEEKQLQKELNDIQKTLQRQRLEFEIEVGLKDTSDLINVISDELQQLQSKIIANNEALLNTSISDKKRLEILKENAEYEKEVIATSKKLVELRDKEFKELQSNNEREFKERKEQIEKRKQFNKELINLTSDVLTTEQDEKYNEELEKLEDARENELITEQNYNKKKEEIEEQHQKRLAQIKNQSEGQKIIQDLLANEKSLDAERQKLLEERARNIELQGQAQTEAERQIYQKRIDELDNQLNSLQDTIDNATSPLEAAGDLLSSTIEKSFTNLFSDEDALKDPWRRAFAVVAGALQELASATITSAVLGAIGIESSTKGVAGLLLIPAISGLVRAAVGQVLNPILSSLTSFATGGQVDSPTLALVGDAKSSGHGSNTEWIFNSSQMNTMLAHVVSTFGSKITNDISSKFSNFDKGIYSVERAIHSLKPFLKFNSYDLVKDYLKTTKDVQELQLRLNSGDITIQEYKALSKQKITQIPKLATGGIATTDTLAVVGDVPGGEAIIPLEQLPNFMPNSNYDFGRLEQGLNSINNSINSLSGRIYVLESDIYQSYNRASVKREDRIRNVKLK